MKAWPSPSDEEDAAAVDVVEQDGVPGAEASASRRGCRRRRRARAPAGQVTYFAWLGRHVGEVDAAQRARRRRPSALACRRSSRRPVASSSRSARNHSRNAPRRVAVDCGVISKASGTVSSRISMRLGYKPPDPARTQGKWDTCAGWSRARRGCWAPTSWRRCERTGHEVAAATRASADLGDPDAVRELVRGLRRRGELRGVDRRRRRRGRTRRTPCRPTPSSPTCWPVRSPRATARLVQVSTDYVFDGTASTPYAEDAPTSPASAYGRTKAAGEGAVRAALPDRHLVVRTAWLYGAHGGCFPRTIARVARERGEVSVVDDQVGQPTWTVDVADLVVRLVEAAVPAGTYHATSSGQVQLVRLRARGRRGRRPGPGDREADDQRPVRPAGPAAGVLGPGPRRAARAPGSSRSGTGATGGTQAGSRSCSVVQQAEQVVAVAGLEQGLGALAQLVVGEEALSPGDLLG